MFDRYRKNRVIFSLERILFSSSMKTIPKKYFYKQAKYGLINDEFKEVIDVINLNQIEN